MNSLLARFRSEVRYSPPDTYYEEAPFDVPKLLKGSPTHSILIPGDHRSLVELHGAV